MCGLEREKKWERQVLTLVFGEILSKSFMVCYFWAQCMLLGDKLCWGQQAVLKINKENKKKKFCALLDPQQQSPCLLDLKGVGRKGPTHSWERQFTSPRWRERGLFAVKGNFLSWTETHPCATCPTYPPPRVPQHNPVSQWPQGNLVVGQPLWRDCKSSHHSNCWNRHNQSFLSAQSWEEMDPPHTHTTLPLDAAWKACAEWNTYVLTVCQIAIHKPHGQQAS